MLVGISRNGYRNYLTTIPAPATGTFINADPLYMTPVDNNLNGMADFWESAVAPGVALTANGDPDGDHSTNREEYLAGTDPLDPDSVFAIQPTLTAGGLAFTWPLAAGRTYAVQSADLPTDKSWAPETVPLPFTFFLLGWTDPAPLDDGDKVYRIQLTVP
jgi:hypothetical protein